MSQNLNVGLSPSPSYFHCCKPLSTLASDKVNNVQTEFWQKRIFFTPKCALGLLGCWFILPSWYQSLWAPP